MQGVNRNDEIVISPIRKKGRHGGDEQLSALVKATTLQSLTSDDIGQ